MKLAIINLCRIVVIVLTAIYLNISLFAQPVTKSPQMYPVIVDSDTIFNLYSGIGVFSAEKRAEEIGAKLNSLAKNEKLNYDSIIVAKQNDYYILKLADETIFAVSKTDAQLSDTTEAGLGEIYRKAIVDKLKATREIYSQKSLIQKGLYSLLYLVLLIIFFWLTTKAFPWLYKKIELLTNTKIKTVQIKDTDVISTSTIVKTFVAIIKGIRFVLSLYALYFFVSKTLQLWPYTRKMELQPIIKIIALLIFYTVLFVVLVKGINALKRVLIAKYESWKGTKIKSIKIKTVEILPAERTVDILTFITKGTSLALFVILFYTYITIIFSLFTFSQSWAGSLLNYVLNPLNSVLNSFINFLPNLFFIVVLTIVFYYIIRAVKFFFLEIDKGTLEFPRFPKDWAVPTYKIVRFMILVLAIIVIFPYLPGSNSPFFQGVSIFVGVLFSLGSTSAIANMVAGVVLTYMRPFKLGDRVQIADTLGDVVEKTLLVTRIQTIKNIDITIPNAIVLGSHILNFSSSALDKGLILNTTVTIGYDVPWKQVHALLISAAAETEFILDDPKPFILQTSLDDFYVSYELNAYTRQSSKMAVIYSDLHSNIQDKFNEAGVEIMSPHYSAMRDGNQIAIPPDYLSKEYQAPAFKLFGINIFGSQNKDKE